MNLSSSLNKKFHARFKCNMYSINCTKIISNASFLAVQSVVGWSVISWAVCAYSEAGEIEKKQSLVLNLHVTIPSCSACFVPFLASLCTDPSSPQEKIGGKGGLYTCQRKRDFCHQMPNDNQRQNDIQTPDTGPSSNECACGL